MTAEITSAVRREDTQRSWHGLEVTATREDMRDLNKAMEAGGINWIAEKHDVVIRKLLKAPVFGPDGVTMIEPPEFEYLDAPDFCGVLRKTDDALLGVHGSDYHVHNPKDVLGPIHEAVLNDERFAWNFITQLRGGKIITAVADFTQPLEVGGDKHEAYLFASTSFDGTRATVMGGTTVRIVCANTLRMAMDSKETRKLILKHRSAISGKASHFKNEIENTIAGYAAYKEIGDALASHKVAKEAAKDMLAKLLFEPKLIEVELSNGKKDKAWSKPSTRTQNNIEQLVTAFETSLAERSGESSAFTILQAITRYADHDRGTRMTEGRKERGETEEQVRFDSNLIGNSDKFKQTGLQMLMEQAKIAA